ncbi:MAG: histidine phosphatase family protein [Firmicutes bacterium]|nr:histidine phosphatase family protein [Bacillota bacterium]
MLLFYLRHGDAIYNPDSLSPLGERQAEALAKRLAMYGIDEIYSSTSNRAQLTAKPLCELLKKDIKRLDFCNEQYVWDELTVSDGGQTDWFFNKTKFKKILASNSIVNSKYRWYENEELKEYSFGKSIERVDKELDKFILELGYEHDRERHLYKCVNPNDKRIALFAHQGFCVSFLSSLLDIPYPYIANHFDICNTGMTAIDFKDENGIAVPMVTTLSNDSHLFRDGLPVHYIRRSKF